MAFPVINLSNRSVLHHNVTQTTYFGDNNDGLMQLANFAFYSGITILYFYNSKGDDNS